MNKTLLCQYINTIKKEDIEKFFIKEGIIIKEDERDLIYNYIKNNYERIIDKPMDVIIEIKEKVSNKLYQKILELYDKYKDILEKIKKM